MAENIPFGMASDVLTPVTNEALAIATLIEAMRANTRAVERVNDKVDSIEHSVTDMRREIAIMQVRDEQFTTLAESLKEVAARLSALETRNAQQDGAMKFSDWFKAWGPWLVALFIGVMALMDKGGSAK